MTKRAALVIPEQHLDKHVRHFSDAFEPLNAQVLFTLRALAQRINDNATEALAPLGLTARKYNYLSAIYVEGKVTPNEIGTLIHTANPTVTSMLNALERDGLIVREAHPEDGRSSVVTLTPRGKALYERAFQLHHDPLEETMATLTVDERKKLIDILVRLGDAFVNPGPKRKRKAGR